MNRLRIISGKHRGKKIKGVDWEGTRPITDRIKENIFNILGQGINGKVLDLFAGSGSIGIESGSRGAELVVFNELNKIPLGILNDNLKGLDFNYEVKNSDAFILLKQLNHKFDYIFLDPPFPVKRNNELLELITDNNLLQDDGCVILRIDSSDEFKPDFFQIKTEKKYGSSKIYVLKKL